MGTIILYILLVIFAIFIVLNIIALITKKKRDEKMEEKFNNIFNPLLDKVAENDESWREAYYCKTVTNEENGILALRDENKKVAALSWKEGIKIFEYKDYKESKLRDNNGIFIDIILKDSTLTLTISNKSYKPSSIMGRSLRTMAEKLKSFLDGIKA